MTHVGDDVQINAAAGYKEKDIMQSVLKRIIVTLELKTTVFILKLASIFYLKLTQFLSVAATAL